MSDITPQRRQRLEKLFHEALNVERSQRASFVARECADDAWMLNELQSLLTVHDQAENFLETPPPAEEPDKPQKKSPALDRYEIIKLLGEGGMGKVYLARDRKLGRQIALKFLPEHLTSNREQMARLLAEARAAATVAHPNICIVYEMSEPDAERPFIALEYVEGMTLRQRLSRKRIKLEEALDITIQMASALAAAHERGIVHRDIKPENIMLRRDGLVKVLDFGLAKRTKETALTSAEETGAPAPAATETGAIMGTVDYMSPEQLRGGKVDARTDIWSLGVILHRMVTDKHPFKGPTTSDTIAAIIEREPLMPSHETHRVPAELEQIIRKALAKNRDRRYQKVGKMAADIRRLQEGRATGGVLRRHWKKWSAAASALLLLTVAGFVYYYFFYSVQRDRVVANSIAVLPFTDDDPNPETDYLSEGLTESLINDLSKFSNIRVVARTSVFRYREQKLDPQKVGRELKVQILLIGRVSRRADSIRVSIELMDVRNNRHLGGGQYNYKQSELLSLQRKLSKEVFENLELKLASFERRQEVPEYTDNSEAYRLYLLGRYFLNKRDAESFRKSIEKFRMAIEKDPHFALPFAGLADAYFVLGQWSEDPLEEATRNARNAVTRALELNEELPEAHISLGDIKMFYDYDWAGARAEYERAIELNPDNAEAHSNYALYLAYTGQHDAALSEIARAQQLDSLSIYISATAAQLLFLAREYDRAIEQGRRVLEMDEVSVPAHLMLGWSYEQKGMYVEAIENFQKYHQGAGDPETLDVLGHAYALAGDERKARALLDEMHTKKKQSGVIIDPTAFAIIHLGLGEKEQAFDWLDEGYAYHSPNLTFLKVHPYFDPYRSEPRYVDLLHRIGLAK